MTLKRPFSTYVFKLPILFFTFWSLKEKAIFAKCLSEADAKGSGRPGRLKQQRQRALVTATDHRGRRPRADEKGALHTAFRTCFLVPLQTIKNPRAQLFTPGIRLQYIPSLPSLPPPSPQFIYPRCFQVFPTNSGFEH